MPTLTPHLRELPLRSIVRIDVHGSKDRAKDASPVRLRRSLVPAMGACALWRMPTAFPSSATSGHPLSSARSVKRRNRHTRTDRPRPSFRRRPAKRAAFQKARMSSTATTREGMSRGEIAPSGLRADSLAHAAHTLTSGEVSVCLIGHCEVTVRSPAVRDSSRVQTPFLLAGLSRLGLTT
jgi:hypothetical protein